MRPRASDRLLAWVVTGPVGHLAGAVADWAELLGRYWLARLRGRPRPFG